MFYFSKSLRANLTDKITCYATSKSNDQCLALGKEEIVSRVNIVENDGAPSELHEYIIDHMREEYIKFFLDIDCDNPNAIDGDTLKSGIDIITTYLKINIGKYFETNSVNLDSIEEDIYVTKSNNPNKSSFHIFYNRIGIKASCFNDLRELVRDLCRHNEGNVVIDNIDHQLYRKNAQLRFIYSCKSKDKYYHHPYDFDEPMDINNISYFSIRNFKDEEFLRFEPRVRDDTTSIEELKIENNVDTPYYIKCYPVDRIEELLINNYYMKQVSPEARSVIRRRHDFLEFSNFYLEQEIPLPKGKCIECEREHKNPFFLKFERDYISLSKRGNVQSCTLAKQFPYGALKIANICEYFVKADLIRRIDDNNFVAWKNKKWVKLTENSVLLNYIYCSPIIRNIDMHTIIECKTNLLNHYIKSFIDIEDRFVPNPDPYILKFNNGYYNLREGTFNPHSEKTKDMFKMYGISRDYVSEEDASKSSDYQENKEFLTKILDEIMFGHDDAENSDAFKKNLSSILYSGHKEVITFFVGETSGGKSTIRMLLNKLFDDSFINLPINCYTKRTEPNTPNPWLGNINHKLISFASEQEESDTYKVISFKDMTEDTIKARVLNSNENKQVNNLSQFIDCNFEPKFDFIDQAIKKRFAVVYFKSYFHDANEIDPLINANGRKTFARNERLEGIIKSDKLVIPFYHMLIKWFRDNHAEIFCMANNNNMRGIDTLPNEEELSKIFFKHTCRVVSNRVDEFIVPEQVPYYKLRNVSGTNVLTAHKDRLIEYFVEKYEDLAPDFIIYIGKKIAGKCCRALKDDIKARVI